MLSSSLPHYSSGTMNSLSPASSVRGRKQTSFARTKTKVSKTTRTFRGRKGACVTTAGIDTKRDVVLVLGCLDRTAQCSAEQLSMNEKLDNSNVSVSLVWDTPNDLGLTVTNPNGEKTSFLNIGNNNHGIFNFTKEENSQSITWNKKPETGKYSISVNQYEIRGENEKTIFKVFVNKNENIQR